MSEEERAVAVLDRVRELAVRDPLRARLTLASLVTELLAAFDTDVVVVGGTAVDTYVSGGLGTSEELPAGWQESLDIDTIALWPIGGGVQATARAALEEIGFVFGSAGGGLRYPGVPFAIDLVGTRLEDDLSEEHLVEVRVEGWSDEGLTPVRLVGPEDLLFDYMESGIDTRHQRDWARAMSIAEAMGDRLDLGYLFSKAHWRREGAYVDALEQLLRGEPLRVEG